MASMVEHHAALYADLADPVALLRGEGGAGAVTLLALRRGRSAGTVARAPQVDAYSR
jgi:demethylspheroidene O-methyltransferase